MLLAHTIALKGKFQGWAQFMCMNLNQNALFAFLPILAVKNRSHMSFSNHNGTCTVISSNKAKDNQTSHSENFNRLYQQSQH